MPSPLSTADLQVGHGELSSGAPLQAQGLVGSGPSRAGEPPTAGVQKKKHAESQGAVQPPLEQGKVCREGRAVAAGLQADVGMLQLLECCGLQLQERACSWDAEQMAGSTYLGSVSQEW